MDDELRSDKRARWQQSTSLKQRWIICGIVFAILVVVMLVVSLI